MPLTRWLAKLENGHKMVFVVVQESNEALSKAKMAAEQSASDCQHLTVECRQLRERLTEQQCRSQKLCDQMLRVSQKCKTDEQVRVHSYMHCAVRHCTVLHCAVLHCTALCCAALCWAALHCAELHCTVLCCTALCCADTLHCTVLSCTALCYTVLHCTVLHCIVLCYAALMKPQLLCVLKKQSQIIVSMTLWCSVIKFVLHMHLAV